MSARHVARWLVAAWLLWALGSAAFLRATARAQQEAITRVEQLMAAFARMPGLEARFVEEKHIGLLAKPLSSEGRLYFARPGLLLRRVERPERSEVIITPDALRLKSAQGEQRIDLSARPDVRPFVESLTWLLAGDQRALTAVYALDFQPVQGERDWQLTLTPRAEPLSHLIAYIKVIGRGLSVSQIQVREKGGDETVTRIIEANPARKFAPSELSSLFGVDSLPSTTSTTSTKFGSAATRTVPADAR